MFPSFSLTFLQKGSYKCVSMTWSPRLDEAVDYIKDLTVTDTYPDAIIMNMGLHPSMDTDEEDVRDQVQTLVSLTNNIADEKNIKFLYHSPTYVDEEAKGSPGNLENGEIMMVNKVLEDAVPKWEALEGYLNLYNYSKSLKSVPGCGRDDGIHFEPVCNYQAAITQWDFNWLLQLRVLEISDRIKIVAHPEAKINTIYTQSGKPRA